ncbi:MAG TPA: hypothetical protein VMB47_08710 [Candidatus Aquilonibacter sp.]|nr:hypothetical protein [Candidatus Aquilonibacter sp.]
MSDHLSEQELRERLNLIESMIAEGRRHTQNWGWAFILWGVAYYVAMGWSAWSSSSWWAWPVTMVAAAGITIAIASSKAGDHPRTTLGRGVGSIWIASGVSMFVLFLALSMSGRLTDPRLFAAIASAMLGTANGASAILLRWRLQMGCAIVWWAAAVAVCFVTGTQSIVVFLLAIFLCQIVFGIYGAIAGAGKNKPRIPAHA